MRTCLKVILLKTIFSLLSSLLLFLSLVDLGFLAWFCLLPLFFSLYRSSLRQAFFYSFLCGMAYFMGINYWVARLVIVPWLILSLSLSTGFVIFGIAACFIFSKVFLPYLRMLLVGGIWVLVEFIKSFTPFAFPIGLLGDSQHSFLPLMQIARFTSIWGVSLIVVLFNLAIFETVVGFLKSQKTNEFEERFGTKSLRPRGFPYISWRRQKGSLYFKHFGYFTCLVSVGMVLLVIVISGILVLNNNLHRVIKERNLQEVKVAIVQPNIPLGEKYIRGSGVLIPESYSADRYFKHGTELVIFPESVLWGHMEENEPFKKWAVKALSKEKLYLLVGQVVPVKETNKDYYKDDNKDDKDDKDSKVMESSHEGEQGRGKFHNSVLFYDPEFNLIRQYDQIHPIPFTQYIPYPDILKILSFLDYTVVDIIPGNDYTPLNFPGKGKIGINICFESTLPQISRNFRNNGAEAIIVISDQASCFDSRAPWYNFAVNSRARAIENGCYVVQCANTGISGIISPSGEILVSSQLLDREVLYGSIFLMPEKTFYSKFGNLLMYIYWGVVFSLAKYYFVRKFLCKNV